MYQVSRLYGPGGALFVRDAIQTHKLGKLLYDLYKNIQNNIEIKKGTFINADFFMLNFDEAIFKNPHKFNPER